MALINCTECNAQISDKATNCIKCGAPVVKKETHKCFECGTELDKGTKVCSNCGADQAAKPQQPKEEKKTIKEEIKSTQKEPEKKKGSSGNTVLKIVIALVVIFGGFAIFNNINSGSSSGSGSGSYHEKVMSVAEIERADPAKFLNASGTYHPTFWGDAMKINGTVTNNATVANYKDVIVEVIFYSETETELERKRYVIYDLFPAHTTKQFELKIATLTAAKKCGWNAVSATAN